MLRTKKEIIFISVLACLWAIQTAVIFIQVLGFCHPPLLFRDALLPEAIGRMAPKWDLWIYIIFIATALMAGKIIYRYYHRPVNPRLLILESVVTFLMVSALFKILVYFNSPQLAQGSLAVLIIISILSKIFYPEMMKCWAQAYQRVTMINWVPYADIWWVGVIVLMIYMPDCGRVMAMIYMGDWLHHFDYLMMCVGYASLWGQMPYVDVISQYGVGLPVIFAKIIQVFGGFDYVPALRVMMWFVVIYFILTYFFVRYWLKSALVAGVAFLLVFRLQMFHYGVSPLVWSVPSASPLRFGLDIVWMALLLGHMRSGKSWCLVAAAIYSGFAPYYMTSVGMCVMVSFYAYLFALIFVPAMSPTPLKRGMYYLSWALPVISALVFFGTTVKDHVWQLKYWHNLLDYMDVFPFRASLPMYESLKYRHFWAFLMSMVVPMTYLATLFYIGTGLYMKKIKREWLLVALLSIYGLGNYQYYVVRAAITSYYVDALPFVLIACFWFMRYLETLPSLWQQRFKAAALVLSFYALLTNQNYLAYPNLMNFSRNPMTDNLVIQRFPDRRGYFNNMYKTTQERDKLPVNDLGTTREDIRTEDDFKNDAQLVDYFRSHFNFQQDAALIKQLTKPGDRVALISSFENKILIQAGRAPFFYHYPLLTSRPMTFRTFPSDAAHLPSFVNDTLSQINIGRPSYIFMEKIFLQDSWPSSYRENKDRVLAIMAFVRAHYQPFEQGEYLVAMKRRQEP